MENNILLNATILKILVFFAGIIAFVLTERRFAFDFSQKAKMFLGFFIAAYLGIVILLVALSSFADYLRK